MSKYFLTGHKTGMWKKEKLSKISNGGSGSLPDTTGASIGDVMRLGSYGPEWAEQPKEEFVITADMDLSDYSLINFDVDNYSDIFEAFIANKNVRIVVKINNEAMVNARLTFCLDTMAIFVSETYDTVTFGTQYVCWVVNAEMESTAHVVKHIPTVTDSDHNKVLGTDNNGALGWVAPSNLSNAPLIVHGTISHGDDFEFTDTTVKDVYDAKVANRAVFLDDTDGFRWNLTGALLLGDTYMVSFGCLKHGTTKIVAAIIGINGIADTTTGGSVIESDLTPNT